MTWLQVAAAVILPVSFLLAAFVPLSLVTNGPLVDRSSNTLRFSKGPKAEVAAHVAVSLASALLLAPFIVRGGRNELTFAIRLAALCLAILEACASGLDKLRGRQEVRESTQVLLVDRWQVYRAAPRTFVNPVQAPLVVRTGGARLLLASIVVLFRWLWRS